MSLPNQSRESNGKTEKRCSICRAFKLLENFCIDKKAFLGVSQRCRPCTSAYKKSYNALNKERISDKRKALDYKTHRNARDKARYNSDKDYKLIKKLRSRIYDYLFNGSKTSSCRFLLGADIKTIKSHLERQFTKGMSWSNQGLWHLDHIVPCCSFDLTNPEEQGKCFHYTNLQPLWAIDNLRKGMSLPHSQSD